MAENKGPLRLGKITWTEYTRNHWGADLGDGVSIEVVRNRSWKRYHPEKPWQIRLFGHYAGLPWQAYLDDAKYLAEREAIDRLGRLAARLGMVYQPLSAPKKAGAKR